MTDLARLREYAGDNDPRFLAYMVKVNAAVNRMMGVSVMDLADYDFSSAFEDGVSPGAAARAAIRES